MAFRSLAMQKERDRIKGEIARIKQQLRLTNKDIGAITGYSADTIAQFMSADRGSDELAERLAEFARTIEE